LIPRCGEDLNVENKRRVFKADLLNKVRLYGAINNQTHNQMHHVPDRSRPFVVPTRPTKTFLADAMASTLGSKHTNQRDQFGRFMDRDLACNCNIECALGYGFSWFVLKSRRRRKVAEAITENVEDLYPNTVSHFPYAEFMDESVPLA